MNASKTAFAMLLGVAFSLELTASQKHHFVKSPSELKPNPDNDSANSNDQNYIQSKLEQALKTETDEHSFAHQANFAILNYTHHPNKQNNKPPRNHYRSSFPSEHFKQKHELIKRTIDKRDIIKEQKRDLEILKQKQDAINTIASIGPTLSNNQLDISKAANALKSLDIKTDQIDELKRILIYKSKPSDLILPYNEIKNIKDDLIAINTLRKDLKVLYRKSANFAISTQDMLDDIQDILGSDVMTEDIHDLTSNSFPILINNIQSNIRPNLIAYQNSINNQNKYEIVDFITTDLYESKISITEQNEHLLDYDTDIYTISQILQTATENLDKIVANQDKILQAIIKSQINQDEKLQTLDDISKKDKELNRLITKLKPNISSLHFYSQAAQINDYIHKIDQVLSILPYDDVSMDKFIDEVRKLDKTVSGIKGVNTLVKTTEQVLGYDYDQLSSIYQDAYSIATDEGYNKELNDKILKLQARKQKFQKIYDLQVKITHMRIDMQNAYDELVVSMDKIKALYSELNNIKSQIDQQTTTTQNDTDQMSMLKARLDMVDKFIKDTQNDISNGKRIISEYLVLLKEADSEYNKLISLSLNRAEQSFYDKLKDSSNYIVSQILSTKDETDIRSFISSLDSSLKATNQILTSTQSLNPIQLNSSLSISTRLIKASNPFSQNLALAYAINKLSKDRFVDTSDNETVARELNRHINSHQSSSNLYQSIIGARGYIKSNRSSPLVYGIISGYDKMYDDILLGLYASYAKSKLDSSYINLRANHYNVGGYLRHYQDDFELDARVSIGHSKTNLKRNITTQLGNSTNKGSYKSLSSNLELEYGYAHKINPSNIIKPIFGISYDHIRNDRFKESGNLAMSFHKTTNKELGIKLGGEYRWYFANDKYAYINISAQKEIYKSSNNLVANFINDDAKFIIPNSNKSKTTYTLMQTGIELSLTQNLHLGINFGTKKNFKDSYYNGNFTIGCRW